MNENFKVLNNGVKMPSIGFGTYKSGNDEETAKIIKYALKIGYRQIDTASFYGNEVGIGNGIKESGIKRTVRYWKLSERYGYRKTCVRYGKEQIFQYS